MSPSCRGERVKRQKTGKEKRGAKQLDSRGSGVDLSFLPRSKKIRINKDNRSRGSD